MIHFQILFGATVFANLYFYIKYKRLPNISILLKAQRENVQEESSEVIVCYTLFSQGFDWQNCMNMLFLNFHWNIVKIKTCIGWAIAMF